MTDTQRAILFMLVVGVLDLGLIVWALLALSKFGDSIHAMNLRVREIQRTIQDGEWPWANS